MVKGETGPFLQAALLCNLTLREKDDVLSIIRIVDRWHVRTSPRNPEDPPVAFPLKCKGVVMFKSGGYEGKKNLCLRMRTPGGAVSELAGAPIMFNGGDSGHNVVMNLSIEVLDDGLYWIDVLLDEDLQTRIPFRVIFEYVSSSSTTAQITPQ